MLLSAVIEYFLSENLEIYHLALPLCIQIKEIARNMAWKRVEVMTNKGNDDKLNWKRFYNGHSIRWAWMFMIVISQYKVYDSVCCPVSNLVCFC